MIRNNPAKDMKNPPGQVRYLRDMIKKYYEDENKEVKRKAPSHIPGMELISPVETFSENQATLVPTDAEKRLQRLKTALLAYLDGDEFDITTGQGVRAAVRQIIEENT